MNDNNSDEIIAGTDGEVHPTVPCFGYNFWVTIVMHVHTWHELEPFPYMLDALLQTRILSIFQTVGLLDTCSTCDVIKNPDFVSDIKECKPHERLIAYCNGGEESYNLVANFKSSQSAYILNEIQWQISSV